MVLALSVRVSGTISAIERKNMVAKNAGDRNSDRAEVPSAFP
jgi:hypothetical protein